MLAPFSKPFLEEVSIELMKNIQMFWWVYSLHVVWLHTYALTLISSMNLQVVMFWIEDHFCFTHDSVMITL